MRVVVACGNCGGRYPADEKVAGKRVKCPGCGTVLLVPTPPKNGVVGSEDVYGVKTSEGERQTSAPPAAARQPAGPVCAACGNPRAEDAVICVHCGLDFRTGTKLSTTRGPKTFGKYSISRGLNGELMLTIRQRRVFGNRERCFDLTGYDAVYYDTLDAPGRSAAGNTARLAGALAIILGGLAFGWLIIPRVENEQEFGFEVGLRGPDRPPIPLHRSKESAEVREIATWLSDATGLLVKREDRRTY